MGSKDSGKSSSKKGSGSSGRDKGKGKSTGPSGKGKETSYQPIEEEEEEVYEPSPPRQSALGGAGGWTQSQLQSVVPGGGEEVEGDINLEPSPYIEADATQVRVDNYGYGNYQQSNIATRNAYGSNDYSQPTARNEGTYPSTYSRPQPPYSYEPNQVSASDALANQLDNMSIQSPSGNYQYASPANQGTYMNAGRAPVLYNAHTKSGYGNSSQNYSYQHTPRASKAVSISGNTFVNYQAAGHSSKPNKKILGHNKYTVHKTRMYKIGHVLKTFWFEPAGSTSGKSGKVTHGGTQLMNAGLPGKVRRFVIIQTFEGHSIGVPINTYGYQGTKKSGCHPEVHSMIYTDPEPDYLDGETPLMNPKVRMKQSSADTLHPASRINYAKRYTIEHNLSVYFIGWVDEGSSNDFWMTLNNINTAATAQAAPPDGDDDEDDDPGMPTASRPTRPNGPSGSGGGTGNARRNSHSSHKVSGKESKDKRYYK